MFVDQDSGLGSDYVLLATAEPVAIGLFGLRKKKTAG